MLVLYTLASVLHRFGEDIWKFYVRYCDVRTVCLADELLFQGDALMVSSMEIIRPALVSKSIYVKYTLVRYR